MADPGQNPLTIQRLLRPHFKSLALGVLVVAGGSLADLLQPWPLKIIIDTVLKGQATKGWMNDIVVRFAGTQPLDILRFAALAVLAIAALGALCSYAEKSLTTTIGQKVLHELRRTLYAQIQRLSLAYHDKKQTGDLISRVTGDIDSVQSFLASGLLSTLVSLLTLFGMIGVMFFISWKFTLIALSIVPVLFAVVFTYTRKIKQASRAVRKKEGEMVSIIHEVFSAVRVVRAFAREDYEQRRYEVESMESVGIALRARGLKAKLSPMVEMIVAAGTCMVLWFGARMVLDGTLSTGSLIVFVLYLGRMYKPMQELSKMTDTYTKAAVAWERIQEVLQTKRDVEDIPKALPAPSFQGNIEFDHVSFNYNANAPVLRDISFQIKPGQMAALVGPTGSGKSTITSLLARFYDPTSGVVKIDGYDISKFQQTSLRQQISFVLQETLLFHGTIATNIAYGKAGAKMEEIVRAAELANATEFIDRMPEGYDTVVGERGVTLSGGQKQRIAIARALIRYSPILILDEPTSGLDAESEQLVFEALDRLMEGKTSIVIAHRLATIRRADKIFVIEGGKIAETGKHDELMARGGLYAKLHDIQFRTHETAISAD
ncbi:MAG: transporter related [Candidatus Solibacter sp.]|jgi:ATP-binding cassette subfamily B protein|nr:transporter related [Candidatus Solibacter sp.]